MALFETNTTSAPLPAGFITFVEGRLVETTGQLNRLCNRLYEAGFPAGPSPVADNAKIEDNARARIYQRLDELYNLVTSMTEQLDRVI